MIVNVGHPEGEDALEKVLTRDDARTSFAPSLRDPVEPTNTHAGRERGAGVGRRAARARGGLPATCARRRGDGAARIAARARGREVYTDDRAPVEWLIDGSILKVAAQGEQ